MVDQAQPPLFSILLPTHNRADTLPFAIQAVLDQVERDFELLVVNDGSTDGTAEVARLFGDPRIRWLHLPKAPHFGYANRNIALREAKGDLIAFAAHDDLLFPDHLALMAEPFREASVDLAYSLPLWAMPDGALIPTPGNLEAPDELDRFLHVTNFIPAQCVVHRRSCLERHGYWPEDVESGGDWDLWRRIIAGGGRANFAYVPTPTGLHFKANWRSTTATDSMAALAAASPWWPDALRLTLAGGRPEQADFSEALRARPREWVASVRAGVSAALGRLALDHAGGREKDQTTILRLADKIACLEGLLQQRESLLAEVLADVAGLAANAQARAAALQDTPPPQFDEAAYLAENPDVAAAVAAGSCPSGFTHWRQTRSNETRALRAAVKGE